MECSGYRLEMVELLAKKSKDHLTLNINKNVFVPLCFKVVVLHLGFFSVFVTINILIKSSQGHFSPDKKCACTTVLKCVVTEVAPKKKEAPQTGYHSSYVRYSLQVRLISISQLYINHKPLPSWTRALEVRL